MFIAVRIVVFQSKQGSAGDDDQFCRRLFVAVPRRVAVAMPLSSFAEGRRKNCDNIRVGWCWLGASLIFLADNSTTCVIMTNDSNNDDAGRNGRSFKAAVQACWLLLGWSSLLQYRRFFGLSVLFRYPRPLNGLRHFSVSFSSSLSVVSRYNTLVHTRFTTRARPEPTVIVANLS